jgi:hypothetical protein
MDGGVNYYAYVDNSPGRHTDPTGHGRNPFLDPPGYVHGSIPELTIDEPSSRVGEIQTACYLLREAKTFCVYAAVSPAIQAGLIGIGRSTIGKRCGKKCPDCPRPGYAIQFFLSKPRPDSVIVDRANVNCNAVTGQ